MLFRLNQFQLSIRDHLKLLVNTNNSNNSVNVYPLDSLGDRKNKMFPTTKIIWFLLWESTESLNVQRHEIPVHTHTHTHTHIYIYIYMRLLKTSWPNKEWHKTMKQTYSHIFFLGLWTFQLPSYIHIIRDIRGSFNKQGGVFLKKRKINIFLIFSLYCKLCIV